MLARLLVGVAVTCLAFSDTAAAVPLLPQDGWLVWESNREDSRQEVYIKKVGQPGENRLTFSGGRLPLWSPDGQWISYFDMQNGWTTIMRPDGSAKKKICDSKVFDWKAGGQFWRHDGSGLVCFEGADYYLYDAKNAKRSHLLKITDYIPSDEYVPSDTGFEVRDISHDGLWMGATTGLFRNGYEVKNGEFKATWAAALINISSKEIFFVGGGCEPTFSPKRAVVFHVCSNDGCANPTDIAQMNLADRMTRSSYGAVVSYPNSQWGHDYYPRISNDDAWLAYSGALEHSGNYDVFIHKLGENDQQRERITNSTKTTDTFPDLYIGEPYGLQCALDADCDDNNACTTDSCGGDFKCSHDPIADCCLKASECDDGDPCTDNLCSSNECTFDAISGCCKKDEDCGDANDCTTDTCEGNVCSFAPVSGCCGDDADCATSNPCNSGTCDTSNGTCTFEPIAGCCAFDTDCDDGSACSQDKCDDQICEHLPITGCCEGDVDCDDGDPCTSDLCLNGGCEHELIACEDEAPSLDATTELASRAPPTDDVEPEGLLRGGCSATPASSSWVFMLVMVIVGCGIRRRSC